MGTSITGTQKCARNIKRRKITTTSSTFVLSPLFFYKIKIKDANCDELLQLGYAHISKELSGTCGIMTEKDDGESFCDISRASTEKINFYCIRPDIQREPTHFKT